VVAVLKLGIPQAVLEQVHLVKEITVALVYLKTPIDQRAVVAVLVVLELLVLVLMVVMVELLQYLPSLAHQPIMLAVAAVV
jgi:hypothetical protein